MLQCCSARVRKLAECLQTLEVDATIRVWLEHTLGGYYFAEALPGGAFGPVSSRHMYESTGKKSNSCAF